MSYTITYNGRTAESLGVVVEHRPAVPGSQEKITEFEIPGRDGVLYRREGAANLVDIPIEMAFVADEDEWMTKFREITAWLYNDFDRTLILSDDPGWYYKVKKVEIGDSAERILWNGGRFTATFTVNGYAYAVAGDQNTSDYYNDYDISHPRYVIYGEGNATLTVNGQRVVANVGQNVTIDTELKLAYRSDGTVVNTSITGDYEDLFLQKGYNSVSITNGFSLNVYPKWRKRL